MGKNKILHIAAHMGDGAGKAISGLAISDNNNYHEIIILEKPNKTNFVDICRNAGIYVIVCPDNHLLEERINACDIVVLNWWNHPSMIPIFYKFSNSTRKIVLWSHVNGLKYPQLSARFASMFEGCLFTSPISLKPSHWSESETAYIQSKSELVYGMGEFRPYEQPCKNTYELQGVFRIGYIGTLDYSKIHPDFLKFCKGVINQGVNARFVLAGEPSEVFVESVKREKLTDYFEFLGFRRDIPELLTTFDMFGYLLNPINFATTENALLEAMAAGLPIITSNSEAERAIIKNGVDGFRVIDAAEYAIKVEKLAQNIELRRKMGTAARESVCKKYDIVNNVKRFNDIINRTMNENKGTHDFASVLGDTSFDAFLTSCPDNVRSVFLEAVACNSSERFSQLKEIASSFADIFKSKKKGSAFHFFSYYPSDEKLKKICELFE